MSKRIRTSRSVRPKANPILKMDVPLRKLIKASEASTRAELQKHLKAAPGAARLLPPHLAALDAAQLRPLRIRSIVRFTGNRKDLEAMGISVRSQAQDVFTIAATRSQLLALAGRAACRRLRAPRMFFPAVEQASAQAEIADVHVARPLNPTGFEGNGVMIGIIDSVLDVTHNGFRDPGGTHGSRVMYYWAQSTHTQVGGVTTPQATPPGQTPEGWTNGNPGGRPNFVGLNYGRLYTAAQINTALGQASPYGTGANQICCEPTASNEHGTHCAGIAAGSGHVANWATAPTHIGAAPRASIVHVRLLRTGGSLDFGGTFEDALLEGIDFCIRAAQFHNMPLVISVSQGSSFGPHNGSSDFDLARDAFLDSFDRRSIVFAAGNDNDSNCYRRGSVAAGITETFTWTHRRNNISLAWLDIWYAGPELDYRVSFNGGNSGWRTAGQDYSGNFGGRHLDAERDMEAGGGLRGIRFYINNAANWDAFTVNLRNPHATDPASYHAWTGLQGWWGDVSGSVQNELTVGDTGCGRSILTVGACDKLLPPNPASAETIAAYSGAGPTVDGRIKPEIVAVGGTAANRIASTGSGQNSGYVQMNGTSMATPLVAGAVALLFEEYGGLGMPLNQDTIKALLIRHANRANLHLDPAQAGYVASERNRYGYGRLRMLGAIDEAMPPVDVDVWIRTADDDYGQEPYPGGCFCGAPDIRVCQAGTNNETASINWGTAYDVRVTVRNLGDSPALGTTVRLKYALPHTAPSAWFEAEDDHNAKLVQTVTVPAMGQIEVVFRWRPEQAELAAPADTHHFCLLTELDHAADPLVYASPTSAGGSAWSANIKGTNNVALRNLHIQ